jgi:hypothetical protein
MECCNREAMVDTDIGPLDVGEEALDVIGVHAVLGLVFPAVVDALEFLQALQIVVAEVLVGMNRRTLTDVLPGELPSLVAVLSSASERGCDKGPGCIGVTIQPSAWIENVQGVFMFGNEYQPAAAVEDNVPGSRFSKIRLLSVSRSNI